MDDELRLNKERINHGAQTFMSSDAYVPRVNTVYREASSNQKVMLEVTPVSRAGAKLNTSSEDEVCVAKLREAPRFCLSVTDAKFALQPTGTEFKVCRSPGAR